MKVLSFPCETLLKSIGFQDPISLVKNLKTIAHPAMKIQSDSSPELDEGKIASIKPSYYNTEPATIPRLYNDVWNIDIGFRPMVAISDIRYTLMCVD